MDFSRHSVHNHLLNLTESKTKPRRKIILKLIQVAFQLDHRDQELEDSAGGTIMVEQKHSWHLVPLHFLATYPNFFNGKSELSSKYVFIFKKNTDSNCCCHSCKATPAQTQSSIKKKKIIMRAEEHCCHNHATENRQFPTFSLFLLQFCIMHELYVG